MIQRFLIVDRFHETLRILSPESVCNAYVQNAEGLRKVG